MSSLKFDVKLRK